MKFDATEGDSGIVTDASDRVIPGAIRGDTHTGWVQCYVCSTDSQPIFNTMTGSLIKVRRRYLAPLKIEPLPKGHTWAKESRMVAEPLEEWPIEE